MFRGLGFISTKKKMELEELVSFSPIIFTPLKALSPSSTVVSLKPILNTTLRRARVTKSQSAL